MTTEAAAEGLPSDAAAREVAVSALGRTRDPRHASSLAGVLRSDDAPSIRAAAARGLASVGGEEAIAALLGVEAEESSVRQAIATALGVLGDARAVPRLIGWLDDVHVRYEASESLGRIGDPAAVPALVRQLEAHERLPRWWARSALAEMGHPDAVEALVRGDRGLILRRLRLRAARRAVARRASRTFHPMARRTTVSGLKELCLAALATLLPIVVLDSDRRAFVVAAAFATALLVLFSVSDRRDREGSLAMARWRAQRKPPAGPAAPLAATVLHVFGARPHRVATVLAVALALEWTTGAAGYAAGLVAGQSLAIAVDRLLLARLVSRWQREWKTRL